MQTQQVVSYNLIDFLDQVQTLIKQGYEFDFKTNQNVPQMIGSLFCCYMLKQKEDTVQQAEVVVSEPEVPKTKQRKQS